MLFRGWLALAGLSVLTGLAAGCGGATTATAPHPAGTGGAEAGDGRVRTYYLAADEVAWDYAPSGGNLVTGQPFGEEESAFVAQGGDRIGRVYRKSLYREYTDATFGTLRSRDPAWEHLGMLGPLLRAEVGDRVEVVFRNNTGRPTSLHVHGLRYDKASEGAGYADGTAGDDTGDDAVAPWQTRTYHWEVPERAGPGPADPSSVMWMYHSHVDEVADTYAGLMGPVVVTRKGAARPDGSPADVDRELVNVFMVVDENASPWLEDNVAAYARRPRAVKVDDEDFVESNLMHSVNGYVYGNQPGLTARQGERVRWYLMGMGTEVDLHTPHWHGNTVLAMGMRTDVVALLPATMTVVDMQPDAPGAWLFHCHVADHIAAGMSSLYRVEPATAQ